MKREGGKEGQSREGHVEEGTGRKGERKRDNRRERREEGPSRVGNMKRSRGAGRTPMPYLQVQDYDYYGAYGQTLRKDSEYQQLLGAEYTFDFPPHHHVVGADFHPNSLLAPHLCWLSGLVTSGDPTDSRFLTLFPKGRPISKEAEEAGERGMGHVLPELGSSSVLHPRRVVWNLGWGKVRVGVWRACCQLSFGLSAIATHPTHTHSLIPVCICIQVCICMLHPCFPLCPGTCWSSISACRQGAALRGGRARGLPLGLRTGRSPSAEKPAAWLRPCANSWTPVAGGRGLIPMTRRGMRGTCHVPL